MRKLFIAVVACLVAACATATPYQPAAAGFGFSEQRLEADRVRITFRGNTLTARETVENYLLYRAAEATIENGRDFFIVVDRDVEARSRLESMGPRSRYGFSHWYYSPRFGWRPWYDPFWSQPEYREVTQYEAIAEIVMRSGPRPVNDPSAFDAREVQRNLQGLILRPAPPR